MNALKRLSGRVVLAALIALPLAVLSDRFVFPGKALLGSLVLVPMILPPFVGAIGIKAMLGQAGAVQRGIESEGIAADKAQFEEARDWDKKMAHDPVWEEISLRIKKYTPFMSIDSEKCKKIILDTFKQEN